MWGSNLSKSTINKKTSFITPWNKRRFFISFSLTAEWLLLKLYGLIVNLFWLNECIGRLFIHKRVTPSWYTGNYFGYFFTQVMMCIGCIYCITVWYEIIFRHLNGYNSANIPGIDKFLFDYCLDINSWNV